MIYFSLFITVKRMVFNRSGHRSIPKREIVTTITMLHTAEEISLVIYFDMFGKHNIQNDSSRFTFNRATHLCLKC